MRDLHLPGGNLGLEAQGQILVALLDLGELGCLGVLQSLARRLGVGQFLRQFRALRLLGRELLRQLVALRDQARRLLRELALVGVEAFLQVLVRLMQPGELIGRGLQLDAEIVAGFLGRIQVLGELGGFGLDGIGRLSYDSVIARDYPVVLAIIFLGSLATILGNLISDFLYVVIDPRIDFS